MSLKSAKMTCPEATNPQAGASFVWTPGEQTQKPRKMGINLNQNTAHFETAYDQFGHCTAATGGSQVPPKLDYDSFHKWYVERLKKGGFMPPDDTETNLEPYKPWMLSWYTDHAFTVWTHREQIKQSAAAQDPPVSPEYLAAAIVKEQTDQPSHDLKKMVKRVSPKLANLIPENIMVSEPLTDVIGGMTTGRTSIGLGQVAVATVKKYNLLGLGDASNIRITYKLAVPKNNIEALAQYTARVARELHPTGPLNWQDPAFVDAVGSRQTSTGGAEFWGESIREIMKVFDSIDLLECRSE